MNEFQYSIFFYQHDKIVTLKNTSRNRTLMRAARITLAEENCEDSLKTKFTVATDSAATVLYCNAIHALQNYSYTAYGYTPPSKSRLSLLGFNGQRLDQLPYYMLGNGKRTYSTVLMRFISPDTLSPFGVGGINTYAYCVGDPVNRSDPSGEFSIAKFFKKLFNRGTVYKVKAKVYDGIYVFDAPSPINKGQTAMTFLAHGADGKIIGDKYYYTAGQFEAMLNKNDKSMKGRETHFITCNLGAPDKNQKRFLGDVTNISGKDATGYASEIDTYDYNFPRSPDPIAEHHLKFRLYNRTEFWSLASIKDIRTTAKPKRSQGG